MVPAITIRSRGVGRKIASAGRVVIVAPEVMASGATALEAEPVCLVGSLVAPEGHGAVSVHVRVDPGTDGEWRSARRIDASRSGREVDPVIGAIEAERGSK